MQALRNFLRHPTISITETCKTLGEINQIHSQLLVNGFLNHPDLVSKFSASIALKHPNNIQYSLQLLDPCHNTTNNNTPTLFALNTLIRVYSKSSTPENSFHFYKLILQSNQKPDNYTFTFLIKSCAHFKDLGLAVHGTVIKYGLDHDPHIQSGLINMYAQMGFLGSLKDLFLDIKDADLVTQTATLVACARLGDVGFARQLFDKMTDRDVVAWNAMISGYVQCGEPVKGLELFYKMMETKGGLEVNEGTMVSVLSACARVGGLDTGRWAHEYIERKKIKISVTLGSALVDMYAKCGDVNMAMEVFWGMEEKNVYAWSAAMGGLAMNGHGEKCVELYRRMRHEGVMPNEVTFTSVLKGCSEAGLVEEGCELFESMMKEFGMEPRVEHYGCMVDLYGLSGRLDEALKFIYSMPVRPHAGAWGALLKACKLYNNVEIGELASRKMVELESNKKDGAYVQLSNIYADFNKWDDVDCVRRNMKSERVAKVPGVSVIETHHWPKNTVQ